MTTVRVAPFGGPSLMTVVRPPASAAEAAAAGPGAGGAGHGADHRPGAAPPPVDPGAAAPARAERDEWDRMRVISANVNGIRAAARRGGLSWLTDAEPDVLCLQEVRASDAQLTRPWRTPAFAGWHVAHAPCGTRRAGPASRCCPAPRTGASGASWDEEADVTAGRWVEAELDLPTGPVTVVSVYVHTGEAQTPRQEEKYRFLDAMTVRMKELADGRPPSWWPATSTSPTPGPTCGTGRATSARPGFLPEEQAYLDRWLDDDGWVDVGRRARPARWTGAVHVVVLARQGVRQRHRLADRLPARLRPRSAARLSRDVGRPRRDVRRALERPRGGRRRLRPGLTAGRAALAGSRHTGPMTDTKPVECWLTDMDGVLVHEERRHPRAPASSSPR